MDRLTKHAGWIVLGIVLVTSAVAPDGPSEGAEHHEGGFVDELGGLLSSPAHWVFEVISDIAVTALLVIVFKPLWSRVIDRWVARHDREAHGIGGHRPSQVWIDEIYDWDQDQQ